MTATAAPPPIQTHFIERRDALGAGWRRRIGRRRGWCRGDRRGGLNGRRRERQNRGGYNRRDGRGDGGDLVAGGCSGGGPGGGGHGRGALSLGRSDRGDSGRSRRGGLARLGHGLPTFRTELLIPAQLAPA